MRRVILILMVSVLAALGAASLRSQAPAAGRPNIVLIMSDDMGYGDLSSYGATDIKTPNIDSLGRDGDWKLVVDGNHLFVFNLRQDIGERKDLTSQRTDIANRLRPMLARWEQEVNAEAGAGNPGAAPAGRGAARGRGASPVQ
jgi:hypothetical protein